MGEISSEFFSKQARKTDFENISYSFIYLG